MKLLQISCVHDTAADAVAIAYRTCVSKKVMGTNAACGGLDADLAFWCHSTVTAVSIAGGTTFRMEDVCTVAKQSQADLQIAVDLLQTSLSGHQSAAAAVAITVRAVSVDARNSQVNALSPLCGTAALPLPACRSGQGSAGADLESQGEPSQAPNIPLPWAPCMHMHAAQLPAAALARAPTSSNAGILNLASSQNRHEQHQRCSDLPTSLAENLTG